MKTILHNKALAIACVSMVLLTMSSCDKWLELHPDNEIILEEYWTSESEVESVLMACYRALITDDCVSRMIAWGELRSDDFSEGNVISDADRRVLQQEITETTPYTSWGSFYTVINYCNTLIHFAPGVLEKDANFTEGKLRSLLAEAYTIRSLSYFYLVRAFQNVPWITQPSLDDSQDYQVAQSKEAAILDSIVYDLEHLALPYAREEFETNTKTKGRVTKNAVRALLADIFLWREDYAMCANYCDAILSDKDLKLASYDNMFYQVFYKGFSTESIFELGFDDDIQKNNPVRRWYGYNDVKYGTLAFPSALTKGQYSPFQHTVGSFVESKMSADIRYRDFIVTHGAGSSNNTRIFKYAGIQRSENSTGTASTYSYRSNTPNWIVYRLPDIILMKAEALCYWKKNDAVEECISLVNRVYTRSNPTADSLSVSRYPTYSNVGELILRERQRELMFEGKRWFDLMRLARRAGSPVPLISYISHVITGSEAIGKMSEMNALYWPVNKWELEANKSLEQNPFYKSKLSSSIEN